MKRSVGGRRAFASLLLALGGVAWTAGAGRAQTFDVTGLGYDRGNAEAAITIIEFGDFGCSACGLFARETFPQFEREFIRTGRVRWKYVPFVLGSFPNSLAATRAAECVAEQDAFWAMHDLLYRKQKEWTRAFGASDEMRKYAAELKLDMTKFRACYDQDKPAERMRRSTEVARALGIHATPTFFINGQRAVGALSMEQWREVIEIVTRRGR